MDLQQFRKQEIPKLLGLDPSKFTRIAAYIDFGNVNYWFEEDDRDEEGILLPSDKQLFIDLTKLQDFLSLFAEDTRLYYGHDSANSGSLSFIQAARHVFGKHRVFTKPMQKIKHYLKADELPANTRTVATDTRGNFVTIPKCNFDVEICVDAIRRADQYDTFCLLSSDADFVHLLRYLRGRGKKIILIKGGFIQHTLRESTDLIINAQDIKRYIATIKQKSSPKARPCESLTRVHGQVRQSLRKDSTKYPVKKQPI